MAKIDHQDVGSGAGALTTELLLLWKPQPNSLVAFVALEQQVLVIPSGGAGGLGTSMMDYGRALQLPTPRTVTVQYKEVERCVLSLPHVSMFVNQPAYVVPSA